ncbi:MAG: hypothetical protein DF168_01793 [Candidatus Moanabacter tarae]|uniref:M23ase beta-sheet core domain-containing protein n=1 Tax=Candidatus Moanibacter tarae TaxID=2200854 RepID=A0A2Z4AHC2_9BACT|nr:MAG: hypothetical protein DF168_01793 [Candidatus Moanabacter tarae]|tara:strand:- start:8046 stop:9125 length:1080 start_codon:yes stop_codon:yes gene_type:complete
MFQIWAKHTAVDNLFRHWGLIFIVTYLLILSAQISVGERVRLKWPTPNRAFLESNPAASYVQPSESGTFESGLYGCFRNSGLRFHEGIDLKPVLKDGRGQALDPIFAVMDGEVVHVNDIPGNSRYGRYIVVEHTNLNPAVYTLYAHLSEVSPVVEIGMTLEAGAVIGRMGHSSGGYTIPSQRAHLHFEMGLMLSGNFQKWYDLQNFKEQNYHGPWNGLNLVGFDPLEFFGNFKNGVVRQPFDHIVRLPTAFTVKINTSEVPDFIQRYPALATLPFQDRTLTAWEIEFSGFGIPKLWRPILDGASPIGEKEGSFKLVSVKKEFLKGSLCREVILQCKDGYMLGNGAIRLIEILFASQLLE